MTGPMTASADAQVVQDALTHPGVHTGQMLASFLPKYLLPRLTQSTSRKVWCNLQKKKWEIFGLCILPQCPLNYSLVKTALVLVGPDSTESREQIFSKHLFCDLATFYWKCQPEWGLEFPWEQTGPQVDSKSSFLVFFPLFLWRKIKEIINAAEAVL